MSERQFPVHPTDAAWWRKTVPWEFLAPHEEQAKLNHGGQSLEQLAERGGLSVVEIYAIVHNLTWKAVMVYAAGTGRAQADLAAWLNRHIPEDTTPDPRDALAVEGLVYQCGDHCDILQSDNSGALNVNFDGVLWKFLGKRVRVTVATLNPTTPREDDADFQLGADVTEHAASNRRWTSVSGGIQQIDAPREDTGAAVIEAAVELWKCREALRDEYPCPPVKEEAHPRWLELLRQEAAALERFDDAVAAHEGKGT